MHRLLTWIVEPGFLSSQPIHVALVVGAAAAVVSAVVGVFTVLRGQSFAGHALTDVSTAGGSGAVLVGVSPLLGFVGVGVAGAGVMDLIGVQRVRGRDLATGIVLGASTGLAALFLYFDTTTRATTGATQQILFGSIFTVDPSTIPVVVVLGVVSVGIMAVIYRPLLLTSVSPDIAAARRIPLRVVGVLFMVALAVAVGLSALAIGAILSTALLVGPAAIALRLTNRIAWAMVVACVIGVGTTWIGVLLAFDSYYWGAKHTGIPVSFMVVALIFVLYLATGLPVFRGPRRVSATARPAMGMAES
ncbi:MAG TPA: metal ABC transporter permease [Acidimicrobiales bacterium]|nr:metal ABC transporter permease [Acidimicrobiales bacterium]